MIYEVCNVLCYSAIEASNSLSLSSAPCVKRFNGFSNAITNNPKATVKITIPVKIVYSPKCSDFSPKIPATLPPSPVAAKYSPIIKDAYLTGASLVTNDKETGEEHNSPMV